MCLAIACPPGCEDRLITVNRLAASGKANVGSPEAFGGLNRSDELRGLIRALEHESLLRQPISIPLRLLWSRKRERRLRLNEVSQRAVYAPALAAMFSILRRSSRPGPFSRGRLLVAAKNSVRLPLRYFPRRSSSHRD